MEVFKKNRCLVGILLCVLFIGCDDTEPKQRINAHQRKLLDSLYSVEIKAVKKEAGYICNDLRDSLFPLYVDSIRELRLIEVDQIINN